MASWHVRPADFFFPILGHRSDLFGETPGPTDRSAGRVRCINRIHDQLLRLAALQLLPGDSDHLVPEIRCGVVAPSFSVELLKRIAECAVVLTFAVDLNDDVVGDEHEIDPSNEVAMVITDDDLLLMVDESKFEQNETHE